ncbi:MAG TPA: MarR family transcriptional regulator [Marmoricola sp.]|nr:MarR family transcriptional regulator [Marmoricola sp.]
MFEDQHFHLMRVVFHEHTARWNALSLGLTKPQYAVLAALAQEPGLDQGSLAEAAVMTKTALAELLVRLEERGVVERRVCQADSRRRRVSLTATGADLLARAKPLADQLNAEILAPLDAAERATLLDLLGKLRAGV